ncbi:hypothetical protein Arub01_35690 [Actinomadura rubrobrunea]|uniref:Uncharacterized protein n=1 Tax=Actinomadura rubrobrunea TaxID=115335 RepID=A0A9W6PWN8_9ACTN|nr:hypothetical protein [Actinomadura rubrobrunea]GLW65325.1 hypothetical protein Arub01_35690 [Actinomadura rubrobrunea]
MGGPAEAPLSAPVAADPSASLGDKTMLIPPTPAWARSAAPSGPADPADAAPPAPPAFSAPPAAADLEATTAWAYDAGGAAEPAQTAGAVGAPPAAAPSADGGAAPAAPTPDSAATASAPPASSSPSAGGSATPSSEGGPAASGGFETAPPPPPAWAGEAGANAAPSPKDPTGPEPIIPESWFARPKRPDEQKQGQDQDQATQVWSAQQAPTAPGADAQPAADAHATAADSLGQTTVLDSAASAAPPVQQTQVMQPAPSAPMEHGMFAAPPSAPDAVAGPPFGAPQYFGGPHGPAGTQFAHPIQGADTAPPGIPPYPAGPHGTGKKGVSKPLLITVSGLVVAALVSVGFVVFGKDDKPQQPVATTTSPAPTNATMTQPRRPAPAMYDQARQVDAVLAASLDARNELTRAVEAARTCRTLPAAMAGFQRVAVRRQDQLRRTQNLKLDKVPNGERLRVAMRQAFQASLEADRALIAWGKRAGRKCRGKPRPDISRASGRIPAERKAIIAKQRLVAIWNPLARQVGLPPRTVSNL